MPSATLNIPVLASPLVLVFIGIILMVKDGVYYGIDAGNVGFLLTLAGLIMYMSNRKLVS